MSVPCEVSILYEAEGMQIQVLFGILTLYVVHFLSKWLIPGRCLKKAATGMFSCLPGTQAL